MTMGDCFSLHRSKLRICVFCDEQQHFSSREADNFVSFVVSDNFFTGWYRKRYFDSKLNIEFRCDFFSNRDEGVRTNKVFFHWALEEFNLCASVQRRDLIFLLRELRFWISFTSSCEDLFNLSAEDVNVILTESERESIGSTRLLLGEPLVGHFA